MSKKKTVKKKKYSPGQQKQNRARQNNEFRRKLQHIAMASDALDAFNLIPESELKIIITLRYSPLRVVSEPELKIPPKMISIVRNSILGYLKRTEFSVFPDGVKIFLDDYFTAGVTLEAYLEKLKDDEYENAAEIKRGFASYMECVYKMKKPMMMVLDFVNNLLWQSNRIDSLLFWFKYDMIFNDDTYPPLMCACLYFNIQKPEIEHINLDGKNRPVYRVGWPISMRRGLDWSTIRPKDLKIEGTFSEIPLKVYIQSHALRRLCERIDCVETPILHHFLFQSIGNLQSNVLENGRILVEYLIFDVKVGYLVLDLVEGIALIRTFLFLTNNGTPEGERLHKSTGLEIIEKKYLSIDKLSTFTLTDLKDDEELKELFTSTGCGCLFELADKDLEIKPEMRLAAEIAKYLGLR
jgi:hypothetical protein